MNHVFNNPISVCLDSLIDLIDGKKITFFDWYDEPGIEIYKKKVVTILKCERTKLIQIPKRNMEIFHDKEYLFF